ncbi:steroid transmembrane transporter SLC22A24-like [Amblyomma americanum]
MLLLSRRKLSEIDLVTSDCYDCADVFGHGYVQRCLCVLAMFCICVQHCHTIVFRLISEDVDHWCKQPADGVMSAATWRNVAIPVDASGRLSRCTVYKYPNDENNTETESCEQWDYDPEQESRSIVSRWDLVCHRRPLLSLAQAVYIAGSLVFMSAVGHVADRVGRIPVLLSAVAFLQLTTLGGCFAASYVVYIISRFFNAGCGATVMVLSWVLLYEASTHDHRNRHIYIAMTAGVLMAEVWFAVARQLPQLDWILRQVFMLSPTVLTLYAFTAAHESARWLVAKNDMARAEITMMSAAKANRFQISTTACIRPGYQTWTAVVESLSPQTQAPLFPHCPAAFENGPPPSPPLLGRATSPGGRVRTPQV